MSPHRRLDDSPDLFAFSGDAPARPDDRLERAARRLGFSAIAGVDEAGRGPWAGPVAVAAVILDGASVPDGLNDSKKLTAAAREALAEQILAGHSVAVVFAAPERIDRDNIRAATLWAMATAVAALPRKADVALIDGRDVPPGLPCPARAVVKGDARSLSIAAASIVAKVLRDRHMVALADRFPGYGFQTHMGYGTPAHAAALARLGPCPAHRRSFQPIRAMITAG